MELFLILDTDLISILQSQTRPAFDRLQSRLELHPQSAIQVSIISLQEQIRGWMAFLNRARFSEDVIKAYSRLEGVFRYYYDSNFLPFGPEAQTHFIDLRRQRIKIGTLDLRIASSALATSSTLLSRNLRDFRTVPGLVVEDWTQ